MNARQENEIKKNSKVRRKKFEELSQFSSRLTLKLDNLTHYESNL